MRYHLLKFLHVLGAILIGGGLISVWLSDLRARQHKDIRLFSEAVRNVAVFYDGVVVPGAVLLLVSGALITVEFYDGWKFLDQPWLAGMIFLFAFEFIEGNTVTRIYFMRLRRISKEALKADEFTAELQVERARLIPAFTHFLDLPMLFLIIALGVVRPTTWEMFFAGALLAIVVASALTVYLPRLYPAQGR